MTASVLPPPVQPQEPAPESGSAAKPPPVRRTSSWTTRRWLRIGVLVSLTVLLALGAVGTWTLARTTDVTDALVNRSSPALTTSVRLEAALVNQETGIRGYGMTGQSVFLEPYTQGRTDEEAAVVRLRQLTAGSAKQTADLERVLARADAWQRRIAGPVSSAAPGAPVPLATERADEGKALFDAIRDAATAQQTRLQDARADARADLTRAQDLRNAIFAVIAAVILALAFLVFEAMRRGITAPLQQLSTDARLVTDGSFDRPISATGPADLRQLAGDVEQMRRRLVHELAFSEDARSRLNAQTDELRRSNEELEQFAYVASHDLQEPLRKIASFCQLLQRRYSGQLDDRGEQYIAFAVDGANRMQTLIKDLLAFSRVGRVHQMDAQVDLETVYDNAVNSLSIAATEAGATITHDPLPAVPGDATQLGMLLQNLIANAIKFRASDRPPAIHVSATANATAEATPNATVDSDGDAAWWTFAVTDNGIGIPAEYADRVFLIFQRLHTKDAFPGNGIGLAMCKKIVEFHGGTIAVDLDHTPGTRITFTLSTTTLHTENAPPADTTPTQD